MVKTQKYLSVEGCVHLLERHKSSVPNDSLCQVWLKLGSCLYYHYLLISSLENRCGPRLKKIKFPSPIYVLYLLQMWLKLN